MLTFVCLAWRAAVAHRIALHRRWALRTYLVANAQWFTRVGIFAWIALNRGPVGIGDNFDGPFSVFWAFGCYLLPLAVLELYLHAKDTPGALQRTATAAVLFVLTLVMGVGIFAVTMAAWLPNVKAAYDPRQSIAATISATIDSSGIDQAEKQYPELKASEPAAYIFDEKELNNLGYELLHAKKYKGAIRVFQSNVEAYPQSSNVYDSLGEAYMDDGEKSLAITNYKKSLELNPKNQNGAKMLKKLNAP
jgi:tetratricopeptide (TPR) repeat protein